MKEGLILKTMLLAMLLLTSCRKDLCYDHEAHTPCMVFDVAADWERVWERPYDYRWETAWKQEWGCSYADFCPHIPEGIRVRSYLLGGKQTEFNLKQSGGRISLAEEGTYSFLLYNNDTEYIVYDDLVSSTRATATTRSVERGGYRAMHEGERTMNQPDMLYGKYIEEQWVEKQVGAQPLPVTLRPLVYTYYIRYEFKAGLEYVALARGALAGMAEMVYLYDGHTGADVATILFDCELKDYGVEVRVKTFGVPDYPGDHYNRGDEAARHYALNLEVRLTNGNYKTFEFDVSDQLAGQPRGGVIVVDGLEVTEEEGRKPEVGDGGFDVGVEGWGDQIDIPLDI